MNDLEFKIIIKNPAYRLPEIHIVKPRCLAVVKIGDNF